MKNKPLDLMTVNELVDLFITDQSNVLIALKKQKKNITKAVSETKRHLDKGGRVVYIGAGTSGRIGLLDAVECKPTFSTDKFIGIIAGGEKAFIQAKEGSEDNEKDAIKDLKKIKLNSKDILIAIAASGETPYTISAIKYAKKLKVKTIGISSTRSSSLSKISDYSIPTELGKEIIQGSSRLKSGTIQKIILNMISSISMIKSGKVFNDLMVDVQPTNKKLVKRAISIISSICKISFQEAERIFCASNKDIKVAITSYKKKLSIKDTKKLLSKKKHNLRSVIG